MDYLRRAGERSKLLFANEEAIQHFSRAAELAPEDPDLRLALADLHELVGNYEEALQLYEQVCKDSSDIRAWRGTASVLRKRGAYAEAVARPAAIAAWQILSGEYQTLAACMATGGTMQAAVELVRRQGGDPVAGACIIELAFLNGRGRVEVPVSAMVSYDS